MRYFFILLMTLVYFLVLVPECSAMDKITLGQAQKIAQRELDRTNPEHRFTLLPGDVQEFDFGWVFGFAPKKFLESHNINDTVPGGSSLVVERDGTTEFLGSSPPAHEIAEFARRWRARHH
ncbi:MAG: YrhB domain-containing protein [Methylocella sp.]